MMNTPICDFVEAYAKGGSVRFHMPGHKGKGEGEKYDITEIEGADVLYSPTGIIKESEDNASRLFSSEKTIYSTEGSSLCIRAMVFLSSLYAAQIGRAHKILASRNSHKTFITCAAILGADVKWLYTGSQGLSGCRVTVREIEEALTEDITALYITSPDYLGNIAPIEDISRLCKERGVLLMVDNAHGAYLALEEKSRHPIALGAHMCCDSAHKTLPALTGAAYLQLSPSAPEIIKERAQYAMSLFASTSPSYLILQSLDRVNKYIYDKREEIASFFLRADRLRKDLQSLGYTLLGDERLKITLDCKKYGYRGSDLASAFSEGGIVPEFYDEDYLVLMLSFCNGEEELQALYSLLASVPQRSPINKKPPAPSQARVVYSPSRALYMPTEKIPADRSEGRVMGEIAVSCPPAVPVAIMGEEIGRSQLELFSYYGIKEISVIKE